MGLTPDKFILAVLPGPDIKKREQVFLTIVKDLSEALQKRLLVVVLRPDSLCHYGEVDSLASFSDKENFISYVCHIEKEKEDRIRTAIKYICPDCQTVLINRHDFANFLNRNSSTISLAAVQGSYVMRKFFFKNPFYIKLLKNKNVNILEIRNPEAL